MSRKSFSGAAVPQHGLPFNMALIVRPETRGLYQRQAACQQSSVFCSENGTRWAVQHLGVAPAISTAYHWHWSACWGRRWSAKEADLFTHLSERQPVRPGPASVVGAGGVGLPGYQRSTARSPQGLNVFGTSRRWRALAAPVSRIHRELANRAGPRVSNFGWLACASVAWLTVSPGIPAAVRFWSSFVEQSRSIPEIKIFSKSSSRNGNDCRSDPTFPRRKETDSIKP